MTKTLDNMPLEIRTSAISRKNSWVARFVMVSHARMRQLLLAVIDLTTRALLVWWFMGLIPMLSDMYDNSRWGQIALLSFLSLTGVLVYLLDLVLHKPLAQRGWPCLSAPDTMAFAGDLRANPISFAIKHGVAWPALLLAVLWYITASYKAGGLHLPVFSEFVLIAASFVLGLFAVAMDVYSPGFGFIVPRHDEVHSDNSSGLNRSAISTQTPASSTPEHNDYHLPVQAKRVSISFKDIYGMQDLKDKLSQASRNILYSSEEKQEPQRNGILLHGEPGNGKTVFAEALAGEMNIPIIQLTYGDVASKWLGEMPRVISNVFAYAKRSEPCVLFIDEIDSFITSRDQASGNSEDLKITNTLLTEIVNIRSHRVVLVGATNYLKNLDVAAIREGRFDFKIEVTPPDETARLGLLSHGLKKHAATVQVDKEILQSVASRWNGFSVSRILAIVKALPEVMNTRGSHRVQYEDWITALREVQGRRGRLPHDAKSLSDLILPKHTHEAIAMVASRLKEVHKIEALGGTLPTGVLFHGPSGTGKTAAARAFAKHAGWSFLSAAGPDLLADRKALDRLFAEAKDLRPTIVFIDEADDVLRNRQYSAAPDICNKLLVLMDGVEDRVKDVVIVAATNNPEQIDPALLRPGRFTEKIEFAAPPHSELPGFMSSWLNTRKVALDSRLTLIDISDLFEGQTIANIEGALQYALNKSISEHNGAGNPVITRDHVNAAAKVVLAL